MTKVLMISTDAKILEEGSDVRARMIEYGKLFEELHIIVFSLKAKTSPSKISISMNTFAYSTLSLSKLFYFKDAVLIGSDILTASNDSRLRGNDREEDGTASVGNCVITCQDPFETGLVGKKLSEKFGIPLHVQIHTDFYSPYFKKSVLNRVRIVLSKKVLPRAKAIRAVSERIRQSLPKNLQDRTSVLPIFTDVESIKSVSITVDLRKRYPRFKKIVLMASRLSKEKDIGEAIDAFAEVLSDHPRAGLVIVGEGPERASLDSRIAKLGLKESVVIEPWVDHETLISYMKTCDMFLSASLYEGYGLSMLEAHMAGATLVATDAGIAPLIASGECLVAPDDEGGLRSALLRALSGSISDKPYEYPYKDKKAYFEAYKADIERTLL